jgi:DNA-binding response OmpR family regulator
MILNPNIYSLRTGYTEKHTKGSATHIGGKEHKLTHKQFSLLYLLAKNPKRVLSINEIMANIWTNTYVTENSLRVHVRGLRKKFGQHIIENRHSIGYILGTEITILPCEK